jgi:hypothetical protein
LPSAARYCQAASTVGAVVEIDGSGGFIFCNFIVVVSNIQIEEITAVGINGAT